MLVGELDVDDVISWFGGTVGDSAGAVVHVLTVDVHFAGTLDGQTQTTVTCGTHTNTSAPPAHQRRHRATSPLPGPPAFLVSTTNSATSSVCPSTRPCPNTFTLEASPISDWPTMILKGLLVTCFPLFFTLTTCSPTSFGVKEIPAGRGCRSVNKHSNPVVVVLLC